MTTSTNVILESTDVAVYGQGNTIAQGVKGLVIGDDQTLNEDGIVTPKINGANTPKNTYVANLTQVGTNAPTSVEITNNISVTKLARITKGEYFIAFNDPLEELTTYVMINSNEHDHLNTAYIDANGWVIIKTTNTQNHQHSDGILNNTTIEIRIY